MRSLKASFLLIGPWDAKLQELGAHIATDLDQATNWIHDSKYSVVALSLNLIIAKQFESFYQETKRLDPAIEFIALIPADFSANQLAILHEKYFFFQSDQWH